MTTLRERLASADPTRESMPYPTQDPDRVLARIIAADAWLRQPAQTGVSAIGRGRHRLPLAAAIAVGTLVLGGMAIAELRPVDEVATKPLGSPLIISGVGPAEVSLPPVPASARYVRVELACFDGTLCATPGGSVEGPDNGDVKVERAALPVTTEGDPTNPQAIPALDPQAGLPVIVNEGTHWRLYALYTDGLEARQGTILDGRVFGIPNNSEIPDYVPAVATNGQAGWVSYDDLIDHARPTLTDTGVQQDPLPVIAADGHTIIGTANISATIVP